MKYAALLSLILLASCGNDPTLPTSADDSNTVTVNVVIHDAPTPTPTPEPSPSPSPE